MFWTDVLAYPIVWVFFSAQTEWRTASFGVSVVGGGHSPNLGLSIACWLVALAATVAVVRLLLWSRARQARTWARTYAAQRRGSLMEALHQGAGTGRRLRSLFGDAVLIVGEVGVRGADRHHERFAEGEHELLRDRGLLDMRGWICALGLVVSGALTVLAAVYLIWILPLPFWGIGLIGSGLVSMYRGVVVLGLMPFDIGQVHSEPGLLEVRRVGGWSRIMRGHATVVVVRRPAPRLNAILIAPVSGAVQLIDDACPRFCDRLLASWSASLDDRDAGAT